MMIRDFFILMLLVSGMVIGGRLLYTDLADTYSVSVNENLSAFDNYMDDVYEDLEDIGSRMENEPTSFTVYDVAAYFIETLKLALKIPGMVSGMVVEGIQLLRLPAWVETMVKGIITATIVFIILSAVLKWRV